MALFSLHHRSDIIIGDISQLLIFFLLSDIQFFTLLLEESMSTDQVQANERTPVQIDSWEGLCRYVSGDFGEEMMMMKFWVLFS